MRWYGQLAVIAVLGGAGYGGWVAYKEGHLQKLPVVGKYAAELGGSQNAPAARQMPPPVVEVDTVKTARIVETREAVGTVRAYESIIVTAKVSGIVEKLHFEEGQKVKAGHVLVELDAEERRADIQQAVAEIRRAEAQRNEVRAQVRTLETAITAAEARRRAAEARLEDLVIRAPFEGRLGTRAVSLGAYVSPGTRITTLDDLSRVRFDFAVPENLLGQVRIGQTGFARSAAYGDRRFEGKVSMIDPRVDPVTRTVRLTAEIPNPDEALKPGMFLSVALQVMVKEDAVVAPEEAIVGEGLRHLIFVVKDNTVERRVVRIGQRQEGRVEIVEGLAPGETIVVRGVQRVRPGQKVEPKPISAEAPAAEAAPSLPKQTIAPALAKPQPSSGAATAAERRG